MKNVNISMKRCATAILALCLAAGIVRAEIAETITLNSETTFEAAFNALTNANEITKLTVINNEGATLSETDFAKLQSMQGLKELDLSGDTKTLQLPNNTFTGNKTLETILFPANMNNMGSNSFNNSNLTGTVKFPDSFNNQNNVYGKFYNCPKITAFEVNETNSGLITIDGVLFDKNSNEKWLVRYPAGKADDAYTIPEGFNKIKRDAFHSNLHLKKLTLNSTSAFDVLAETLGHLTALEYIDVASENITYGSMNGMLYNQLTFTLEFCPGNLLGGEHIVVDGNEIMNVANDCFRYVNKLESITFTEGVEKIGRQAVRHQTNGHPGVLKVVYLPATLTNIGGDAFCQRKDLETVVMRATTPPTIDDRNAFYDVKAATFYVPAASLEDYKAANFNSSGTPAKEQFKPFYNITITDGTSSSEIGEGIAAEGMEVSITATPKEGQIFDKWVTESNIEITDVNATETTFTIGAEAVSITATYKDAPTTSVETVETENMLIYPNPATDFVYIKGVAAENYTLYNLTGAVVAQGTLNDSPISVAHLADGVYVVKAGDKIVRFVKGK